MGLCILKKTEQLLSISKDGKIRITDLKSKAQVNEYTPNKNSLESLLYLEDR